MLFAPFNYIYLTHLFKSNTMQHVFLIYNSQMQFKLENHTIKQNFHTLGLFLLSFTLFMRTIHPADQSALTSIAKMLPFELRLHDAIYRLRFCSYLIAFKFAQ